MASFDEMSEMPMGSLGFRFQRRMHHLGVDVVPKE